MTSRLPRALALATVALLALLALQILDRLLEGIGLVGHLGEMAIDGFGVVAPAHLLKVTAFDKSSVELQFPSRASLA